MQNQFIYNYYYKLYNEYLIEDDKKIQLHTKKFFSFF